MSLCRIAWRLSCVEALKGKTLVGNNVLDSEIGALDLDADGQLQTDKKKPFIAVYTDHAEAETSGMRGLFDNGKTVLRIEMGVTEKMVIEQPDPEQPGRYVEAVVPGIPHTSGSFELTLDLLARQVIAALSDADNPFANVFRSLAADVSKIERQRVAGGSVGERIAAQQIAITAELLPDPLTDADMPADGPIARCLGLFDAAGDDLAVVSSLLRAEIRNARAPWQDMQELLGLTGDEAVSAFGVDMIGDELAGIEIAVGGRPAPEVGDV